MNQRKKWWRHGRRTRIGIHIEYQTELTAIVRFKTCKQNKKGKHKELSSEHEQISHFAYYSWMSCYGFFRAHTITYHSSISGIVAHRKKNGALEKCSICVRHFGEHELQHSKRLFVGDKKRRIIKISRFLSMPIRITFQVAFTFIGVARAC